MDAISVAEEQLSRDFLWPKRRRRLPRSNPLQVGVFRYGYGTPIAKITDGTSNTMAVAEYLKGVDSNDTRGLFYTNRAGCQTLFVTLGPNSAAQDNICAVFCPSGGSPNQLDMNLPCTGGDDNANFASPRSRHPGGVNTVFCDGSVHFIQNSIDMLTWQSLGWIADGNAIAISFERGTHMIPVD